MQHFRCTLTLCFITALWSCIGQTIQSILGTTHQSGVSVPSPPPTILGKFILTLSLFLSTISKLAQQGLRWR